MAATAVVAQLVPLAVGDLELQMPGATHTPTVAVYVKTDRPDPLDLPTVVGAWAIIKDGRIRQSPLRELPEAASHAQGVLLVLAEFLGKLRPTETEFRVVVPDGAVADMLFGRIHPQKRQLARLVDAVRRLVVAKAPNARVEVGRFYDIALAGTFDDAWE
jgi:hypothetical protein